MKKISCVYTVASPSMIETVEKEIAKFIKGEYILTHHTTPDALAETVKNGYITHNVTAQLINEFTMLMNNKTNVIFNICSSVGDVAELSKDLFMSAGVHIVRIDEAMCNEAVKNIRKIGVMATLCSTLDPSCRLLMKCAEQNGIKVELVPLLVNNAFGKSGNTLINHLVSYADEHKNEYDGLVLAQLSMAAAEQEINERTGKPVYSSLRYGAKAVADIVNKKQV